MPARYGWAAAVLALAAVAVWAQDDEFEQFRQQEEAAQAQFEGAEAAAFEAFAQAEAAAFAAFKAEVERQWGQYEGSTRTDWVEYEENLQSRSRVDFEEGVARVEVLVEPEAAATVEEQLQKAVESLVTDQGKTSDYRVELPDGRVEQPKPLAEKPVLEGQVQAPDGTPVAAADAAGFARQTVKQQTVQTQTVKGKDGTERLKASVSFPLVPDHLKKRADRYAPLVRKYAARFDLEAPLVFAVIHTESHFNPKARSGAPAYGLMQLVPKSGGREAYRFAYKKDRVLPAGYFYDPERNVELGCAYLRYLHDRIFNDVGPDLNAEYCAIAAYNTGAGNVSRAFTGKKRIRDALPLIRGLEPEALYRRLVRDLPYEETRQYLQKVVKRKALYEE